MPKIAATKPAWIRDDWNWGVCESSPGVYAVPSSKQAWLDAAYANGLKVVAILNYPPSFYSNPWSPPTKAANFCAWLSKYEGPKIAAIEVINEPNNTFASQVGAGWKQVLVTLTTAVYDAVHAASLTSWSSAMVRFWICWLWEERSMVWFITLTTRETP